MERYALALSAVCHDLGHPGLNNTFLVETSHDAGPVSTVQRAMPSCEHPVTMLCHPSAAHDSMKRETGPGCRSLVLQRSDIVANSPSARGNMRTKCPVFWRPACHSAAAGIAQLQRATTRLPSESSGHDSFSVTSCVRSMASVRSHCACMGCHVNPRSRLVHERALTHVWDVGLECVTWIATFSGDSNVA